MAKNLLDILIPKEVENLQLPDPSLLTYYKNLSKRIFWIDDDIDSGLFELVKQIVAWNEEDDLLKIEIKDRRPIKLLFFSQGGELDVNNTLIDVITMSKTPVWGINIGSCCSAAAFIYLSCHRRLMLPQSYFLFHQGSGSFSGTYQQVCSQIESYQDQINKLMSFMLAHTKYSKKEISRNIINEWYVKKDEALKNGVCDEVISDMSKLF